MTTDYPIALYTDGGCVYRNPSRHAATWAWVAVDKRHDVVARDSGILVAPASPLWERLHPEPTRGTSALGGYWLERWPGTPRLPDSVSNNHAEWVALVRALEAMPDGWDGLVHADSVLALNWMFTDRGTSAETMDLGWWQRGHRARQRMGVQLGYQHVKGHPTRTALRLGRDHRGRLVSRHNVAVDAECTRMTELYHLHLAAGVTPAALADGGHAMEHSKGAR